MNDPRLATLEDIEEPQPEIITSRFRGKDGAFLKFAIQELTNTRLRAFRELLNEEGKAKDGDEDATQRVFVQMCVVAPELDEPRLVAMQKRGLSWGHLVNEINRVNGIGAAAGE